MHYFKLPDLGEGLQEADIVEWHVAVGETVRVDQLLVSVETAKAIVEVPSPVSGTIVHRFAEAGDCVRIGEPLVEFAQADGAVTTSAPDAALTQGSDAEVRSGSKVQHKDSGTVVGDMPQAQSVSEDHFSVARQSADHYDSTRQRVTPSVRALARRLSVDLAQLSGSGEGGRITAEDVEKAGHLNATLGSGERLQGVRKHMARNMARAHAQVVPVTLFDEADVTQWNDDEDTTVRLVQAIAFACRKEPNLNVWFEGEQASRRLLDQIDLGIAVDTEHGLFVPVLRDIAARDSADLRAGLNRLKADVKARTIPPAELQGATFTLSNYGALAGRYGTPVVLPPQVAILGAGRVIEKPMASMGELFAGKALPLSLTFDHRVVTGGEAARFMAAVIDNLQWEPDVER